MDRKLDIGKILGNGSYYEFKIINQNLEKSKLIKNRDILTKHLKEINSNFNDEVFAEWIIRHYLAGKMVLSGTLLINSSEYSDDHNLQLVTPYLQYYTLLNLSRGLILTCPLNKWNEGEIIELSHSSIIKRTTSIFKKYNLKLGNKYEQIITRLKFNREVVSYKFPSSGDLKDSLDISELEEISQYICDLIQFQSEINEMILGKNKLPNFTLKTNEILKKGYVYKFGTEEILDSEDAFRIAKHFRLIKNISNIALSLTEGLIDDYFGARTKKDNTYYSKDSFNPDEDIRRIFDFS